jgi:pimeloyl-ACP methyl ester carboxylesterase
MDLKSIREGLRSSAPQTTTAAPPKKRRWGRVAAVTAGCLLAIPLLTILAFYAAALLRETQAVNDVAPPTGRLIDTAQGRIFIQENGPLDGPPVLLIHGTAAWSELWRETIDHLANEKFRVIAIDLPPFGFSDRPDDGNYTRAGQAARIAALVDALRVGPVFLVGHSFGAGPTVETVMRYPGKVRGLVLVAGALGISDPAGPQPPPALVTALLNTPLIRNPLIAAAVTNPLMTKTLVRSMVYRRDAVTDHRVAVLQRPMTLRNSTPDLGNWLRYFVSVDAAAWSMDRKRYKAITTKTALIWGDRDTLTPLPQGRDIQGLIGGTSLAVLPDLGHIPQIEDPAVFAPQLVKSLRTLN